MPLHANPERDAFELDGLNHVIVGSGDHSKAGSWLVNRLVVIHGPIDCRVVTENFGKARGGVNVHGNRVELTLALLVLVGSDDLRQVLNQGSALVHVEHLCTATNPQEGKLPLDDCREQGIFEVVSINFGFVRRRMRHLAVSRRVNVFAATDDQSVESVKNSVRTRDVEWLRWNQHRNAAGLIDRVKVDAGEERRLNVPHA